MEQETQPKFGKYIPTYLQADLAKAHQSKQSANISTESVEVKMEQHEEKQPDEAKQDVSQTEPQSQINEEIAPNSTTSEQNVTDSDNDVKAWKGRLKKEQSERQQLNARLIEEVEARDRAEKRVRELEVELHQKVNSTTATTKDPKGLSEDELSELKIINPDLYLKIKNTQAPSNEDNLQKDRSTEQQPNVNTQAQTQPVISERERIWYTEVQREIPEIQGLLGDPKFVEFAQEKADWTGTTGLDLIQKAGASKDVLLIPIIRHLLDEYKQSQTPAQATITVAPQTNATVKAKVSVPKEITKKDEAHAEMLARLGKTKELREFLAKFKK